MFPLIVAITLRILVNPLANVFQKKLTVYHHPLLINFLTYFCLSLICIFPGLKISWYHFPSSFWIFSVLTGICGALGNGFLVKALQQGELSVLGPVNAYKSVVSMITGIFLLGEIPNGWGLLGVALIIYGSYYVLETTDEKFSFALFQKKEIQYRLVALVLTAVEAVFLKKVILASDAVTGFISWCWFGALFSFIVLLMTDISNMKGIKNIKKKQLLTYIALIGCIGIMQFTTNYAFERMEVGYVLALFQLSLIIAVLFGYKFFKEQRVLKKLLGSLIMIVGSVVIILLRK